MTKQIAQLCARIKLNAAKGDKATAASEKQMQHSIRSDDEAERHYIACGRDLIALRKQLAKRTGNEKRVDFKRYVKAHCGMGHVKAYRCINMAQKKISLAQHKAKSRAHHAAFRNRNREARNTFLGKERKITRPFTSANGRSPMTNLDAWLVSSIIPKVQERLGGAITDMARRKNFSEDERDLLIDHINRLRDMLHGYVETINAVKLKDTSRDSDGNVVRLRAS